jgi:hypothetical protein
MLVVADDQKIVTGQRMKRVPDRNFGGQNPGIMNSLPTEVASTGLSLRR